MEQRNQGGGIGGGERRGGYGGDRGGRGDRGDRGDRDEGDRESKPQSEFLQRRAY